MQTAQKQKHIELFTVSFLILFIEVALIRWISTEIRIFAYVNNLVLLACFLGIGLGCYFSRRRIYLSITAIGLLILIVAIHIPFFRDTPLLLSAFTDSLIWFEPKVNSIFLSTFLGIISTLIIFFVILFVFVPLGQTLGGALNEDKNPIRAYSVNITASILGIWCFSGFSFIYSGPDSWFGLITAGLLVLVLCQSARSRKGDLISILVLLISIFFSMVVYPQRQNDGAALWSPYQKLKIKEYVSLKAKVEKGYPLIRRGYAITVNNVWYMALLDLSDSFIKKHLDYFNDDMRKFGQYDIPYMFKKDAKDVLILGAGAGNDSAGALRNNVECVDAVEIDPGIYDLGLKFHPEKPYSDPRSNVIINDARSFLKKSKKKYDIISFGLLDAHASSSDYNNMRIDHYVYTEESFQEAKRLLKEDGTLTVIFEPPRPWVERRIHDLLKKVFAIPPIAFSVRLKGLYGWGGTMFVTAKNADIINSAIKNNPKLAQFIRDNKIDFSETRPVKLTTDDWPYIYLEKPIIPKMHLSIMVILLLFFVGAKKAMLAKGQRLNLHFFFLGAAFLLLEFQNITKATLLFGATWLANAFILSAILLLILFANFFVSIFKIKNLEQVYLLLILSIFVVYLVPLDIFNFLDYWQKSVVAGIILNLPIFFAGIIFISSFRRTQYKDSAFGSNFIGAAMGGILESLSFVFGINKLLLIVIAFYCFSFIFLNIEIHEK